MVLVALVHELQRLEDQAGVGTAAGHPATFGPTLQAEGHQPHRGQRFYRPRRRQINSRIFEPPAQKTLDQQCQRRDEDVGFHPRLDLMIDRPHCHDVLELPEPALDIGQVLVQRHGIKDAQPFLTRRDHIFSFDLLLAT